MKRKFLYWFLEVAVVLTILVTLFNYTFPKFLEAQNINTPENFPDPVFRRKVEFFMGMNSGGRFSLSEAAKKNGALILNSDVFPDDPKNLVTDCTGLHFFQNIDELQLYYQPVKSLNVSALPLLKKLNCSGCNLTELDISQNPDLEELDCSNNPITELDLHANRKLKVLNCIFGKIQSIDLSDNLELEHLYVGWNPIPQIEVSHLKKLKSLAVQSLPLARLDISQNSLLEKFWCSETPLKVLDVSNHPHLTHLLCRKSQIVSLNLESNPELKYLDCRDNSISFLDLRKNVLVEHVDLRNNQFKDVPDFSANTKLRTLGLENNLLTCEDYLAICELKKRFTGVFRQNNEQIYDGFFYSEQKGINLDECGK